MAELEKKLKDEIEGIVNEALRVFDPNSIEPAIKLLMQAWDKLPSPKEQWYDSFIISKYLTHAYFNSSDNMQALEWAKKFNESDPSRDFGESEFMLAKIYFSIDKKVEAKEYFKIAEKKSDGRVWKGESDMQYIKFYKRKND